MASKDLKKALKRLEKDWQELLTSPVPNVAAAPLESNMLEWHCNIQYNHHIYHLILFFSKEYPCVSPRLEMMPPGFSMQNMVVMKGGKGTTICLDIFSDFAKAHPEWMLGKSSGWSPSYTVQALLLNLLSYFHEKHHEEDAPLERYKERSMSFVCADCGHSQNEPFPPIEGEVDTQIESEDGCLKSGGEEITSKQLNSVSLVEKDDAHIKVLEAKIFDYVSREKFSIHNVFSTDQLFGYGLVLFPYEEDLCPTSPCEFVTANSFHEMCDTLGAGKSILREDLSFFLPLYITDEHAAKMRPQFEITMAKIAKKFRFKFSFTNNYTHVTINVFCNLLSSIVDECHFLSRKVDNVFDGYFQIHRLFLWVLDTYPKVLKYVNKRLSEFLSNPSLHNRRSAADYNYCFALLSVSNKHTWESIAEVYLREHWRRCGPDLARMDMRHCGPDSVRVDMPIDERLQNMFDSINGSCSRLAYHVAFLKMAKPKGFSKERIIQRYSDNLSFPSKETVSDLRGLLKRIDINSRKVKSFNAWYEIIDVPVPSKEDLFRGLKESMKYALATRGYCRTWKSR